MYTDQRCANWLNFGNIKCAQMDTFDCLGHPNLPIMHRVIVDRIVSKFNFLVKLLDIWTGRTTFTGNLAIVSDA